MKQPITFRILMAIGGFCGILCGMIIAIHAIVGFLPLKVANPWIIAPMGFLAAVGGFCLLIEKINGRNL